VAQSHDVASTALSWDVQPLTTIAPELASRQDRLHGSVTQKLAWVTQWQRLVNPDCICIIARSADGLEFVLTLEVIKQGPLSVAIYPGERHANENFPCVSPQFAYPGISECIGSIKTIVKEKRPDIDAIYLHRQVQMNDRLPNPVLPVDQSTETDIALSFALKKDFQAILEARDGSKKQKKIRRAARQLEERGGWSYQIITDPNDIKPSLESFFTLKERRLAKKGITNVFGPAEIQMFFIELFSQSLLQNTGEYELHVLKVANQIAAIAGITRAGGRLNVEFTAVDDSDPGLSHGDFLYFHMISNACERGVDVFSFGIGDEPFKRSWCNVVTPQFNTAIALTWKGSLAAKIDRLMTHTKRTIKSNKALYQFFKRIRKPGQKNPA
jgi:CelD/BcsL family acetyltransferase involved in cellulose biosynthesis